jgi:hypothetical protein
MAVAAASASAANVTRVDRRPVRNEELIIGTLDFLRDHERRRASS